MGTSHFKSNVIGFAGTEYLATFAKVQTDRLITTNATITTLTGVTTGSLTTANITTGNIITASSNVVKVSGLGDSSYIQLGVSQYLFVGNTSYSASMVAEATALVGATIQGSLYMSRKGNIWYMKSNTLASPIGVMD